MGKAGTRNGEMADRSVVVSKSEPMKAGNSMEGKTWMSMRGLFFYAGSKREKMPSCITCFHFNRGKTEAKGTCLPRMITVDKDPAYPTAVQQLKDEKAMKQETWLNCLV
ncbi:MAG: hypothetical protein WD469_09145 [Paenibacillaceae bacterium]